MKSVTTKLVIKEICTNFHAVFHTIAAKLFFVSYNARLGVRYQVFAARPPFVTSV